VPLRLAEVPLKGLNLIEASAGTGKTHTITGLYLRLLLERELPVNAILVVTYTKAATAELKARIRETLSALRCALSTGSAEDALIQALIERCADRGQAVRILYRALHGFDEAAIFTIHGFCQRVLTEYAFESASPLGRELSGDDSELLQEVGEDFWRREVASATRLWAEYLCCVAPVRGGPGPLLGLIETFVGKPYLSIQAPATGTDMATLEAAFECAHRAARTAWVSGTGQIRELVLESKGLNRSRYRRSSVEAWLAQLAAYLDTPVPTLNLFDKADKFCRSTLEASTKKGGAPPCHPFFEDWEGLMTARQALIEAYGQRFLALQEALLEYADTQLSASKKALQLWSYDDLLIELDRALQAEHGEALAQGIRGRYRAALIDEYQDTDPIQYRIFSTLYQDSGSPVFLVGDPKQAIYSFRGADVFAYLKGRQGAQRHYTLDTNWRSTPGLIRAVNTLFAAEFNPFQIREIGYLPVVPAPRTPAGLEVAGETQAPLGVWCLGGEAGQSKTVARARCAELTARGIAQLLDQGRRGVARLGGRSVCGADIVVLVRTHRQGAWVRQALRERGIASVLQSQENVFHSPEAEQVQRLLLAVVEPEDTRRVRAALATDLLGITGDALFELLSDELAWDARVAAFQEWHRLWRTRGFVHMFRALLEHEGVIARLLALPDGARRATNVLHIAELLQHTAATQRSGLDGLIGWLAARRRETRMRAEEYQQRLESDDELVRIVTIHRSKGLQYPIVFCPFLWDVPGPPRHPGPVLYHDPDAQWQACLRFGPDPDARAQAQAEDRAEQARLLYVALTRAVSRCCLIWGPVKGASESALGHILAAVCSEAGRSAHNTCPDPLETEPGERRGEVLGEQRLAFEWLSRRSGEAIRIEAAPEDPTPSPAHPATHPPALRARPFRGRVRRSWQLTSYTRLFGHRGLDRPDYDEEVQPGAGSPEPPRDDIFGFPRGSWPGQCLHAIFERLDFLRGTPAEVAPVVGAVLEEFGFEARWAAVITAMVCRVLETPLHGTLCLGRIARTSRLDELEFHYPLAWLDAQAVNAVLSEHVRRYPHSPCRELAPLDFKGLSGFLKGFIDLVFEYEGRFYVVDYKSNWLGDSSGDYAPGRLREVMGREGYVFQYLVYGVAVHRLLRQRLPDYDYETHFGGVCYLFLRGMDPATDTGVFRERPPLELIEALDRLFVGDGP